MISCKEIEKKQGTYFLERFNKFGDSHLSLDWNSKERQYIGFKALTRGLELEGKKVLDVGCGLGHLFEYFKETRVNVDYTGTDLVREMVEHAQKKHQDARFIHANFLDDFENDSFDIVFMAGIFNIRMDKHWEFVTAMLRKGWENCKEAMAFNMITNYVDYREPYLYYANPLAVFHNCKKMSKKVSLYHDYLPFEFTIIMDKTPFPSQCYSRKQTK